MFHNYSTPFLNLFFDWSQSQFCLFPLWSLWPEYCQKQELMFNVVIVIDPNTVKYLLHFLDNQTNFSCCILHTFYSKQKVKWKNTPIWLLALNLRMVKWFIQRDPVKSGHFCKQWTCFVQHRKMVTLKIITLYTDILSCFGVFCIPYICLFNLI